MKKVFVVVVMMLMALGFSMQAQAALQTIGTATYGGMDYNLIYDNDDNLLWLDYRSSYNTWYSQMSWASGLNVGGVLTYNFNAGVSMSWSGDWRLPSALNQDGSGPCRGWSCSGSEMGHLYYTEFGNAGWVRPGYEGFPTGDFQNQIPDVYWAETEANEGRAAGWFSMGDGRQWGERKDWDEVSAIAVRNGQIAVVPEPISSTLFIVGGATLGFRRFRKK